MSTHDMNIANQGFPQFRTDLNAALAALASTSASATAPTTTFSGQLWFDTTNNLLKLRNAANSAWVTLVDITSGDLDIAATDITTGTITGTGSASFGSLTVTGTATFNGNTILGNAATDTVVVNADVNSDFIPYVDSSFDLGSTGSYWANAYIDAITTTGAISVGGALTVNGNTTLGNASTDVTTINGEVAGLAPTVTIYDTAASSFTHNLQSTTRRVEVQMVGAGGGSSSTNSSGDNQAGASGGAGAGAEAIFFVDIATLGISSLTLSVGTKGAGDIISGGTPNLGTSGTSSTYSDGTNTITCGGGQTSGAWWNDNTGLAVDGGDGGTFSASIVSGLTLIKGINGQAGGNGIGVTSNTSTEAQGVFGGNGGSGMFGAGGSGGAVRNIGVGETGQAGQGNGSGGGGSASQGNNSGGQSGANGADGKIVIIEYQY